MTRWIWLVLQSRISVTATVGLQY